MAEHCISIIRISRDGTDGRPKHAQCTRRAEVRDPETGGLMWCPWHAPKKYAQPSSSGLSVEITEATDSLLVELSWDGRPGPVVERFGHSP